MKKIGTFTFGEKRWAILDTFDIEGYTCFLVRYHTGKAPDKYGIIHESGMSIKVCNREETAPLLIENARMSIRFTIVDKGREFIDEAIERQKARQKIAHFTFNK